MAMKMGKQMIKMGDEIMKMGGLLVSEGAPFCDCRLVRQHTVN